MAAKNLLKHTSATRGAKPAARAIVSQTVAKSKVKAKTARVRKNATMC